MPELDWRIYFEGGITFDSSMGAPNESPNLGVIAVVFRDVIKAGDVYHVGRMILKEEDFYTYMDYRKVPPRWQPHNLPGLIRTLVTDFDREVVAVREGRIVPFEEYREIIHAAETDPDFPRMSGQRRMA